MIQESYYAVAYGEPERLLVDPRCKPRMYQTPKSAAVQARKQLGTQKFRVVRYSLDSVVQEAYVKGIERGLAGD